MRLWWNKYWPVVVIAIVFGVVILATAHCAWRRDCPHFELHRIE